MKINAQGIGPTTTNAKVCPTCGTCPTCGSKHPQTGFMPNWPYPQTVIPSHQGVYQSDALKYDTIN